jgi:hypothetical protein
MPKMLNESKYFFRVIVIELTGSEPANNTPGIQVLGKLAFSAGYNVALMPVSVAENRCTETFQSIFQLWQHSPCQNFTQ